MKFGVGGQPLSHTLDQHAPNLGGQAKSSNQVRTGAAR